EPLLHRPRLPREQRAFAYFLRGLLFYRDQLFVSAAQDYQRALEFDPSHAPAQNALAWLTLKGLGVAPNPRRLATFILKRLTRAISRRCSTAPY
ncbi:MAG: tetratricopeptide repeat protein, partial [Pseudomonadales bacterium]